jgi:hypothetical protein
MDSRQSPFEKLKSWFLWLLSVLCTAIFISASGLIDYLTGARAVTLNFSRTNMAASVVSPSELDDAFQARPARRHTKRQSCVSGGVDSEIYNTSLHVGALFIILGVSFLACALPILIIRFSRLRIPTAFLFFVRHFGTGVLIATAFVHLLPTAFTLLGDPCLSGFWTEDYPAMPGAISLGGIFLVTLIEMVFSPVRHATRRIHKSADQEAAAEAAVIRSHAHSHTIPVAALGVPQDAVRDDECASQLRPKGPLVGRSSSFSRAIHRIGEESDRIYRISSAPEVTPLPQVSEVKQFRDREGSLQDEFQLSEKQKHNKDVMQVFMLEVGILFHSVFIGMSLSVSVGNEFVILLIAIVFHRKLLNVISSVAVANTDRNIRRPCSRLADCLSRLACQSRSAVAYVTCLRLHVRLPCLASMVSLTILQHTNWSGNRHRNSLTIQPRLRSRSPAGRHDECHFGRSLDLRFTGRATVGRLSQRRELACPARAEKSHGVCAGVPGSILYEPGRCVGVAA